MLSLNLSKLIKCDIYRELGNISKSSTVINSNTWSFYISPQMPCAVNKCNSVSCHYRL